MTKDQPAGNANVLTDALQIRYRRRHVMMPSTRRADTAWSGEHAIAGSHQQLLHATMVA
jgi:hypothetical protein